MAWAEDPSNTNVAALRPRLRLLRGDRDGVGSATGSLGAASIISARNRAEADCAVAAELVEQASLRPEGFCLLSGSISARSLAALVQAIAGSPFPPPSAGIAILAASLRPATLFGVRLLPAGRLGTGLVLAREEAAMVPPVPAQPGAVWDRRFLLDKSACSPPGATIGALGADAARLRRYSPLPSAVLRTLPAMRHGDALLAVPHLLYPDRDACACFPVTFSPPRPAASAAFFAAVGSPQGSHAFGDA
jgi:tRNA(Ile)-lysidine synthase